MSSGTVGVLVSVVSLSFVTVIIDIFTGFVVDWVTLGYISVTEVALTSVEDRSGTRKFVEIKLEFLGMDTVGTFNVVEEVDHVLLFKVSNDSVTTVLFNSVTAGFGLFENAKISSVDCGAVVLFTGFVALNHTLDSSPLGITDGFLGMYIAVGGCKIKGVGSVGIGMRLFNFVVKFVYSSNPSCANVG